MWNSRDQQNSKLWLVTQWHITECLGQRFTVTLCFIHKSEEGVSGQRIGWIVCLSGDPSWQFADGSHLSTKECAPLAILIAKQNTSRQNFPHKSLLPNFSLSKKTKKPCECIHCGQTQMATIYLGLFEPLFKGGLLQSTKRHNPKERTRLNVVKVKGKIKQRFVFMFAFGPFQLQPAQFELWP